MAAHANGVHKIEWEAPEKYSAELYQKIKNDLYVPLKGALQTKGKFAQKDAIGEVTTPYVEQVPEEDEDLRKAVQDGHPRPRGGDSPRRRAGRERPPRRP